MKIPIKQDEDQQGARVMRAEEYQALMYAIEACRTFASRQSKATCIQALRALQMLIVFSNWRDEQ